MSAEWVKDTVSIWDYRLEPAVVLTAVIRKKPGGYQYRVGLEKAVDDWGQYEEDIVNTLEEAQEAAVQSAAEQLAAGLLNLGFGVEVEEFSEEFDLDAAMDAFDDIGITSMITEKLKPGKKQIN